MDRVDHFFVMVGQMVDDALVGSVHVRLRLSDGAVVEGVPLAPASDVPVEEQFNETGYGRWIAIGDRCIDMADVREAAIVYPLR